MQYPLISEYIEAIRSAEDNFDKLNNLRPVLDSDGNPVMSSGNFAVVFKMEDVSTHRLFAVKCFIKEQEGRGERYALIAEELQYVSSPYLLHVRYLERELFVSTAGCDEEEFPVLVMDWVEGQPLDAYLKLHLNDQYELEMLTYRFCKMGAWLLSQPFAHGDLKPDNILVREDGSLVLVDYDGMYVPAMEGQVAAEIGSPDFRHPSCTEKDFNEHIDDFSIASIALSLKAISLDSQLYDQYAAADRLLFSAANYRDIGPSAALQAIMPLTSDTELSTLLSLFLLSLAKNSLNMVSFRVLLFNEPEKPIVEILSTKITDEERKNAVKDKFGAEYTVDGLKLIRLSHKIKTYTIKESTKIIGDEAFIYLSSLTNVIFNRNAVSIGDFAFANCKSLETINLPQNLTDIGEGAFLGCEHLQSIDIPNNVRNIGGGTFSGCENLENVKVSSGHFLVVNHMLLTSNGKTVISCWSKSKHINIPNGVKIIEKGAFSNCDCLKSIFIPKGVIRIGESSFFSCN